VRRRVAIHRPGGGGSAAGRWQRGCSRPSGQQTCHYYWQVGGSSATVSYAIDSDNKRFYCSQLSSGYITQSPVGDGMRSRSHIVQSIRRNNRLRPRCYPAMVSLSNGYRRQIA
jgi:hypothetical protein